MKRNLLLLTAVVLAAVLLAGCTWPLIGNAVKISVVNKAEAEDGKLLIEVKDLAKEYKKNDTVEITFEYTEAWQEELIEFKFDPKDVELVATPKDPVAAEEGIEAFAGGFLVEGTIGKKPVTITISVKVPEEPAGD